jgi:ABC-type Fe3+ transport system substrate-binding protein
MAHQDHGVDRRQFLKGTGAIAGTGLVAGCLGGGGSDGDGGGSTATPDLQARAEADGMVREATSITGVKEFYGQFEDDTGIDHERFRSDATKVGTRILQEFQADNLSFDFQRAGDPQPAIRLRDEGVYDEIPDVIQDEWSNRVFMDGRAIVDWYGLKLSLLYNTDMVDSPPSTLEEMATEYAGEYSVDVRDEFIWVALKEEHGEERAKELVGKLGEGSQWVESHFTLAKNVAAGEVPMGLTYNKFKYYEETDGVLAEADLDDLPNVVREITSHVLKGANRPDAATLYMQYSQENVVDFLNNAGRPDAYFRPEQVIGNDDFLVWGVDLLDRIDLEQAVEDWEQYTGLSG